MRITERIPITLLVGIVGAFWLFPTHLHAGLLGPPTSFVLPTNDGQHIFVMLSSIPVADDTGKLGTLPDGQEVNLRKTFPASGLYYVGSTTPIWRVDWCERRRLVHLSDDGRYVVRINRFGGGGFGEGIVLRWGIKFYDAGVEIKTHDVKDLVDYPSLMEYTSSGWHYLWIDRSAYEASCDGLFFTLMTSTHEKYRFDVTTGDIVEEHHFWRPVAHCSIAALAIVGLVAGGLFVHRRRKTNRQKPTEIPARDANLAAARTPSKMSSFSVRALFVLTTIVAVFCWVPHIALFLATLVLAVGVTRWSKRKATTDEVANMPRRIRRLVLSSVIAILWFLSYCLSAGPAFFLLSYFRAPHDVRAVFLLVVYAPLEWLYRTEPAHAGQLINWYLDAWN